MAAKGVRLYAKKQALVDPIFYARKHESVAPYQDVLDDVRAGADYAELKRRYPDADEEDLRRKAIGAIDQMDGSDTMAVIDRNGVDDAVDFARYNAELKESMLEVLRTPRKASYIHPVKAESLRKRLSA